MDIPCFSQLCLAQITLKEKRKIIDTASYSANAKKIFAAMAAVNNEIKKKYLLRLFCLLLSLLELSLSTPLSCGRMKHEKENFRCHFLKADHFVWLPCNAVMFLKMSKWHQREKSWIAITSIQI